MRRILLTIVLIAISIMGFSQNYEVKEVINGKDVSKFVYSDTLLLRFPPIVKIEKLINDTMYKNDVKKEYIEAIPSQIRADSLLKTNELEQLNTDILTLVNVIACYPDDSDSNIYIKAKNELDKLRLQREGILNYIEIINALYNNANFMNGKNNEVSIDIYNRNIKYLNK